MFLALNVVVPFDTVDRTSSCWPSWPSSDCWIDLPLLYAFMLFPHNGRIAVASQALEAEVLVLKAVNRSVIKSAIWKPN